MTHWIEAFALTISFEGMFLGGIRSSTLAFQHVAPGRLALAFLAGNLLSHPIVWHLGEKAWTSGNPALAVGSLEVFAVILEGACYGLAAGVPWRLAFAISLGANSLSAGLGLILLAT